MSEDSVKGERSTWWVRHAAPLKTAFRVILGVVWLVDGILKFTPGS
jgi:hypothetical protein